MLWPEAPREVVRLLVTLNVVIWLVFAADLLVRLALAPRRVRYVLRHPVDVLSVLLPMLRPLRVLRIFTAGHMLFTRGAGLVRTGQAVLFSAAVLVTIGALAILDAERAEPGATITTFGEAMWWAMVTVTTVGYGDHYPVTGLGGAVAAALMVVGISLLGVVTASVAAWFVNAERVAAQESGAPAATDPDEAHHHLLRLDLLHRAGVLTDEEHAVARGRVVGQGVPRRSRS